MATDTQKKQIEYLKVPDDYKDTVLLYALSETDLGRFGREKLKYLDATMTDFEKEEFAMDMIHQWKLLKEFNEEAEARYEVILQSFQRTYNVNEELKEKDPMRYIREMTELDQRTKEIIRSEMIYDSCD